MTAGVLVYMLKGAHVLLARRNSGVSMEKLNGPGGLANFGENATKAAMRTVQAGLGVTPTLGPPLGEVLYHHPVHGNWKVTVWRTEEYVGEPTVTTEMTPEWHPVDAIPYDHMWAGDDVWMPYVVDNVPFLAELWFDANDHLKEKDVQLRRQ